MLLVHVNNVHAVDPNDGQVDLPLQRMGQNTQQKTQNDNVNLFQSDQVGDLGKQQRKNERHDREKLFQKKSTKITLYNDHHLFNNNDHVGQVNYTQTQTNNQQQHHYYRWLTIIVTIVGLIMSWKMVKQHE